MITTFYSNFYFCDSNFFTRINSIANEPQCVHAFRCSWMRTLKRDKFTSVLETVPVAIFKCKKHASANVHCGWNFPRLYPLLLVKTLRRRVFRQSLSSPSQKKLTLVTVMVTLSFFLFLPLFPSFLLLFIFFSPLPQWWNTLRSIKPVKPTQSRCNTTGRARYSQHVISDSLLRKIKRVEVKRDPLKCLEILITIRVNLLRDKTRWVWEMETGLHFGMYLFCLIFWNVFSDININ